MMMLFDKNLLDHYSAVKCSEMSMPAINPKQHLMIDLLSLGGNAFSWSALLLMMLDTDTTVVAGI